MSCSDIAARLWHAFVQDTDQEVEQARLNALQRERADLDDEIIYLKVRLQNSKPNERH